MSALVPVRDPERGDLATPTISRNNSVSTLTPPKVPELNENHSVGNGNGTNATSNGKPASSSILNVNKSTNKVNSELTTLNETQGSGPAPAAPPPVQLTKHKLISNGPRGWGRLKAKTGTNPETESFPKQEPSRVTNDPQSESSPVKMKPGYEPSSSVEAASEPGTRPVFNIPKLSLSSDSEAVAGPGPGGGEAAPMVTQPRLAPPEYTQMVANLMDFKVNYQMSLHDKLSSANLSN